MKKQILYAAAALAIGFSSCQSPEPQMVLEVDMNSHEAEVPESMYGSTMQAKAVSTEKC